MNKKKTNRLNIEERIELIKSCSFCNINATKKLNE